MFLQLFVRLGDRLEVSIETLAFAAYLLRTIAVVKGYASFDPHTVDAQDIKIAAIKIIRSIPGTRYGLADAKRILDAVCENYEEVVGIVRSAHLPHIYV
jgi:ribosomal protein L7/L12